LTLRIERISGRRRNRIRLSGEFRAGHIDQVKAELRSALPPVVLDLAQVSLVDVECIRFLNGCEAGGIPVQPCSSYVRKWMSYERREKEKHMESNANVALVHGAWADGSSWSKVIPLLQRKGLNVTAVQIPLTSLEDDIAVTRRILSAQEGPTVLVGHSYGGLVITGAANGVANVQALVYIAAFALEEGESIEALGKQGPPPAGAAAVRPDDHGFLWIDRDGFGKAFAADADPTEAAVMAAVQKPLSVKSFAGKSGPPAWKHIPSWYMVATDDQMIPPPAEEFMAKRIGATVKKVASSHAAMVSHPKEVADLITLAVESVGKSANTRVSH
jgi:pimeloyl-ACP methyl ester carboxylesterase